MKMLLALVLSTGMSGCAAVPAAAIYSGSLKGVERVGALYLAETRPGIPTQAGVMCLTDTMKRGEVIRLGSKDSRSLTLGHRAALKEIAARSHAVNCLAVLGETAA